MGCTNTPDLERIRGISNPEAILYQWFAHESILAGVDFVAGGYSYISAPQSCSRVEIYSDQLDDRDAVEAFRSACRRYDAITKSTAI